MSAKLLLNHGYQSLFACDGLGYLSVSPQGAFLSRQVISARHQQRSILPTANLPFAAWGKGFDFPVVATVNADQPILSFEVLTQGRHLYG
ncbi:MAG: ATP-binding protein [Deltaproteobacteria bacterium]|nr:ATP-binding protein [Deltaproteobacteria bacterium]MBW2308145.1 ATP-binding protein [Deltaproteobacteria bacterium]